MAPVESAAVAAAWAAWWKSGRTDDRARGAIIEHYKPAVERVLRSFRNVRPCDKDDLRGAGYFGICKALDEWNPARMAWLDFLRFKIRYAMVDQIRAVSWVPKGIRARATKIETTEDELATQLGRMPTPDELAERLEMTVEELESAVASFRATDWSVVSLDHRQGEETPWLEAVIDPGAENPADAVERWEDADSLDLILQRLSGRDRLVIRWKYFSWPRVTQKQIAGKLGVHESRVSQILAAALERAQMLVNQRCMFQDEVYSQDERFTVKD